MQLFAFGICFRVQKNITKHLSIQKLNLLIFEEFFQIDRRQITLFKLSVFLKMLFQINKVRESHFFKCLKNR